MAFVDDDDDDDDDMGDNNGLAQKRGSYGQSIGRQIVNLCTTLLNASTDDDTESTEGDTVGSDVVTLEPIDLNVEP